MSIREQLGITPDLSYNQSYDLEANGSISCYKSCYALAKPSSPYH